MINLILGKNGSGKTTYLNKEYNNLNDEWTKILFPTASEISSLINDKVAENCKELQVHQKNQQIRILWMN